MINQQNDTIIFFPPKLMEASHRLHCALRIVCLLSIALLSLHFVRHENMLFHRIDEAIYSKLRMSSRQRFFFVCTVVPILQIPTKDSFKFTCRHSHSQWLQHDTSIQFQVFPFRRNENVKIKWIEFMWWRQSIAIFQLLRNINIRFGVPQHSPRFNGTFDATEVDIELISVIMLEFGLLSVKTFRQWKKETNTYNMLCNARWLAHLCLIQSRINAEVHETMAYGRSQTVVRSNWVRVLIFRKTLDNLENNAKVCFWWKKESQHPQNNVWTPPKISFWIRPCVRSSQSPKSIKVCLILFGPFFSLRINK